MWRCVWRLALGSQTAPWGGRSPCPSCTHRRWCCTDTGESKHWWTRRSCNGISSTLVLAWWEGSRHCPVDTQQRDQSDDASHHSSAWSDHSRHLLITVSNMCFSVHPNLTHWQMKDTKEPFNDQVSHFSYLASRVVIKTDVRLTNDLINLNPNTNMSLSKSFV